VRVGHTEFIEFFGSGELEEWGSVVWHELCVSENTCALQTVV